MIPPLAEEVQVDEQQMLETGLEIVDSQSDNEGIAMRRIRYTVLGS